MPADKRKAAPTTASPSSKKTKKATEEPPAPLRRSTRSASTKADPPPALEKSKPAAVPKAKAAEKGKEKAKPVEKKTNGKTQEKNVTPRKRAADFYSAGEGEESDGGWDKLHADEAKATGRKGGAAKKVAAGKKEKVVKKAKTDGAPAAEKDKVKIPEQVGNKEKAVAKEPKKAKAPASDDEISLHSDSETEVGNALNGGGPDSEQDSADEEEDDQTATLLKGFESSDDDEEEGEPEDVAIAAVKNKEFRNLTIPDVKQKIAARSDKKASGATPGYIYLGRIPHGFYEHEMRAYFSQFGTILRLRLSRNKKTGRSKHYAFIEFADSEAAAIVAETMDNYLLFGHILKCKVIPRSDIKDVEALFKGANKRFKPIPWSDVKQRELEKKRTVEEWERLEKREDKRRKDRENKLKSMGIDYQYEPVKQIEAVVPAVEEPAPKAVEAALEVEAEKEAVDEAPKEEKKKGGKREKKAKAEKPVSEGKEESVKAAPAPKAPKEKTSKKAKAEKPMKDAPAPKEKAATAPKKAAKKTKGKQ